MRLSEDAFQRTTRVRIDRTKGRQDTIWIDDFSAHLIGSRELEIAVDCSVSEAVGRLERNVRSTWDGGQGLFGRISGTSFTVYRRRVFLTNNFAPVLRGRIRETSDGACLEARFSLSRFASIPIVFQVGIVALAVVVWLGEGLVVGEFPLEFADAAALAVTAALLAAVQGGFIFLGRVDADEIEWLVRSALFGAGFVR